MPVRAGWSGASKRFRGSAKCIPNLQECKDATSIDGGSFSGPESSKEEKPVEQMSLGGEQPQGPQEPPCDSGIQPCGMYKKVCSTAHNCNRAYSRYQTPPTRNHPSSTRETILQPEEGRDTTDLITSQDNGWGTNNGQGANNGWNQVYNTSDSGAFESQQDDFGVASRHDNGHWGHATRSPDFHEGDLGKSFCWGSSAQELAPGASVGGWERLNCTWRSPPINAESWMGHSDNEDNSLPAPAPMVQHHHYLHWPRCSNSNQAYSDANTWSPGRQTNGHTAAFSYASPVRRPRPVRRPSHYWGPSNPGPPRIKIVHGPLTLMNNFGKQPSVSSDDDATDSNDNKTITVSDTTATGQGHWGGNKGGRVSDVSSNGRHNSSVW